MPASNSGGGFFVGFSHIFGVVSLYCGAIGGKLVASGGRTCYKAGSYYEMPVIGA